MREVGQQLFDEVSGWVDELIQRCMDAAGGEVRCVAHSDHGMAPVHHDLYPNAFFERQGWLVYDSAGVPDMHKSAVVFHPADNGLLLFNEARLAMSGHDPVQSPKPGGKALRSLFNMNGRCSSTRASSVSPKAGRAPAIGRLQEGPG